MRALRDLQRATRRIDDAAGGVLSALADLGATDVEVMIVGAVCRDALHTALGMTEGLTVTSDLDLALGVGGWDDYEALTSQLERVRGAGSRIRYRIAGVLVDLVPFGHVEEPRGEVVLPEDVHRMSVFAFREVHARATPITLSGGATLRLPSPAGYAALKLKAWVDRRPDHESKDGRDLGTAMSWYQHWGEVHDRLYAPTAGDPAAQGVLESAGFAPEVGAVMLLGRDAMSVIGQERHDELRELWRTIDDDLLATDLGPRLGRGYGRGRPRADARVLALRAAIEGPTPSRGLADR